MAFSWPWQKPAHPQPQSKILWLDLGDLGDLVNPSGPHEQWQDHGLGLLRTILHQNGIQTDLASTRAVTVVGAAGETNEGLRYAADERPQLHLPLGL